MESNAREWLKDEAKARARPVLDEARRAFEAAMVEAAKPSAAANPVRGSAEDIRLAAEYQAAMKGPAAIYAAAKKAYAATIRAAVKGV